MRLRNLLLISTALMPLAAPAHAGPDGAQVVGGSATVSGAGSANVIVNLPALGDEQLADHLTDTRKALFNLRFQSATGTLENVGRLKIARREIARILTVQYERAGDQPKNATQKV